MALNDTVGEVERKLDLAAMPKRPYKRLLDILRIQSTSGNMFEMQTYIINKLRSMDDVEAWYDENGNILAVKGDSDVYPAMVCHMDTVHKIRDKFTIYSYLDEGQKVLLAKEGTDGREIGIGGDDKNGIFATLEMIKRHDAIKVAFFVDEEIGCLGSDAVDLDFFSDVGYVMQLDRWGNSDLINDMYGDTTSKDFDKVVRPVMKEYGYEFTNGLATDSLTLHENNVGVSCVNISCGYYMHHTNREIINTNELWAAINFADEMIKKLGNVVYASLPEEKDIYSGFYGSGWTWSKKEDTSDDKSSESTVDRYIRNADRKDLTAADIYDDLYDRLIQWHTLSYDEKEEIRDDWVFLYGYDLEDDEIEAYAGIAEKADGEGSSDGED